MKFVILDEVDYMTKNAQQALKYLLQNNDNTNIRFCLICNYISKIDEGLQNEFIKLRFNQLPKKDVMLFLKHILTCEHINIDDSSLYSIQKMFGSDIRSMINFLQSNQFTNYNNLKIINNCVLEELIHNIKNCINNDDLTHYIYNICQTYNSDIKNIIKTLLNYIIRTKQIKDKAMFFNFTETLIHSQITNNYIYNTYALMKLKQIL
jgi:DNA polymerase III delta prime subunit